MKNKQTVYSAAQLRPPIVAVLGHVDHGKTSLLDYIRKSNVTAKEHGGITQHIGAYQVKIKNQKSKIKNEEAGRLVTFIDTPGHEAFAKMRSRGAGACDIAVLVVAADDSVKPQTKESINLIIAVKTQMIVAINKMDLPSANPEKVKQDLAKAGVQVEGFGGDVPVVPISAKTGAGVADLLDMILLVADMKGIRARTHGPVEGVVIETRLDKGKGMVGTVIVKNGILRPGDPLYDGPKQIGKVRALFDENGVAVREAGPSKPVEVLGFNELPAVGRMLATATGEVAKTEDSTTPKKPLSGELPDFLKPIDPNEAKKLVVLLKADTAGSLEAITHSLDERVTLITTGSGDITDADVLQAKSSGAIVIGFNVNCRSSAVKLAQTEKVVFRTYTIIYELLDELSEVLEGLKVVVTGDRELGSGQVIAEFPYEGMRVAGTKIVSGRMARGDLVKIMRSEVEIGRAKVKSIRTGKEDTSKVAAGNECGILLDRKLDFKLGDGIIAFTTG